jgi:hypothetical protein
MFSGCGSSGRELVPVTGTVKYSDGTVPKGEVMVIRFEPVSLASGTPDAMSKAASGAIQADGSFRLHTIDPDDGAFPGEYKVAFTIMEEYESGSPSLVAAPFTSGATSPLSATVKSGDTKRYDFVIDKAR